jgi:hypothetical protein
VIDRTWLLGSMQVVREKVEVELAALCVSVRYGYGCGTVRYGTVRCGTVQDG